MSDRREWFKSSYSGGANTECVETALRDRGVDVRDAKNPEGPVLTFSRAGWAAFIRAVRAGEVGFRVSEPRAPK
ncbi:DUF397 domain-containing protein [Streptomyces sp. NBC_01476]|uniref:DUF397 domain-containing protein n=1 Tax=Streptomyces sp. NBC_01476 TaxID=2903881 RepID=UPI002E360653|nr:DUF397 domain-containing protein [Streptomyces sp. NBC_01476]